MLNKSTSPQACSPRERKQVATVVVLYALVFVFLALRQYDVFGRDTGDIAAFHQMFWRTVHGKPFFFSEMGLSMFALHTSFLWAQVVPIYWLFQSWRTLVIVQSCFLAATAVPMYLIARHIFRSHFTALIVATAFLFFPPIVSQNLNQLEEPSFLIVYLLFAFYFYLRERFWLFMLFAVIASLGRENIPLAICMFGVYSMILRRTKRWVITPIVFGAIYFWLALYVFIPYFLGGRQWHAMRMFTYLGDTPHGIVLSALNHPGLVVQHLLQGEVVNYFVLLIQPLAWLLPFLSPASIMALPDLTMNLLTSNSAMRVIPWHYNVVTGSFLFIGTAFVLAKLGKRLRRKYGDGGNPELVMALGWLVLVVAHWFLWFNPSQFQRLPQHDALERAVAMIPAEASVACPHRTQVQLGNRPHYHNFGIFLAYPEYATQFAYVLLDANERQYPPFVTQEFFDKFYKNPNYRMIFAENNVFLFERVAGESDWKIPLHW